MRSYLAMVSLLLASLSLANPVWAQEVSGDTVEAVAEAKAALVSNGNVVSKEVKPQVYTRTKIDNTKKLQEKTGEQVTSEGTPANAVAAAPATEVKDEANLNAWEKVKVAREERREKERTEALKSSQDRTDELKNRYKERRQERQDMTKEERRQATQEMKDAYKERLEERRNYTKEERREIKEEMKQKEKDRRVKQREDRKARREMRKLDK